MAKTTTKFPFDEVDDFQLQELIYEGPHTLVFRGFQSNLNRPVLIKLLKPFIKERKEYIERFQREARVCAQFKHPNIVGVFKLGEKSGYHYIALEFVEGISLKGLLSNSAPLPLEISFSITDQILEALIYVHQHNIIHRDIKPGNILIDRQGRAKLTDFGLAHLGDEVSVTLQGSIIGTPAYMAPEQIVGGALDGRTDLFSLGAVMYEMLTGKQAFGGESYSTCLHKIVNEEPQPAIQLNPQLPNSVDSLVAKFLKKDPEERWEDAQQARENLHQLAAQYKINLGRASTPEFIQPFVSSASTEGNQSPELVEQKGVSQRAKSRIGDKFSKRWILISGLAAVVIPLLAILLWMGTEEDSAWPAADKQTNLVLTDSGMVEDQTDSREPSVDDLAEDSIASSKTLSVTKSGNDHKAIDQIAQQPDTFQERIQVEDTLFAEHSLDRSPKNEEPTTIEDAAMAQLNIWVEPWAKIMVDEREIDSQVNQSMLSLAPGKHTLTFLHPNFSPHSMQVEIQSGEEKTVRWSFLKNAGFLWIEVRPWAEIYIDNQYRDSTPLGKPIALSAGKYLLELKHPQLPSYRDYVTVQQGDTLRIQIVLKE